MSTDFTLVSAGVITSLPYRCKILVHIVAFSFVRSCHRGANAMTSQDYLTALQRGNTGTASVLEVHMQE
jgi:hypothetical protein